MKKLILLALVALTFASCSKDKEELTTEQNNQSYFLQLEVVNIDGGKQYSQTVKF